jgi:MFS transporter, DHA1 family, tetracycline resistance protein
MALWGFSGPPVQGLMTRRVAPSQHGQLQGANGSLLGIAELIGPGIFTLTFATFISTNRTWHLPGAAFLLAALMLVAAMALAWRLTHES